MTEPRETDKAAGPTPQERNRMTEELIRLTRSIRDARGRDADGMRSEKEPPDRT